MIIIRIREKCKPPNLVCVSIKCHFAMLIPHCSQSPLLSWIIWLLSRGVGISHSRAALTNMIGEGCHQEACDLIWASCRLFSTKRNGTKREMKPPRWPGPQQANSRIVGGHVVQCKKQVCRSKRRLGETRRETQRCLIGRSYVPFSGCHKATLQPNIFLKLAWVGFCYLQPH